MVALLLLVCASFAVPPADSLPEGPVFAVEEGQTPPVLGPLVCMPPGVYRSYAAYRRAALACDKDLTKALDERDAANERVLLVEKQFETAEGLWMQSVAEIQAKSDKRARRNFRNGAIVGAGGVFLTAVGLGLALNSVR